VSFDCTIHGNGQPQFYNPVHYLLENCFIHTLIKCQQQKTCPSSLTYSSQSERIDKDDDEPAEQPLHMDVLVCELTVLCY